VPEETGNNQLSTRDGNKTKNQEHSQSAKLRQRQNFNRK